MALPEPKPGLVVRYDYLWSREAAAGRDQGKDRPACLVAVSDSAVTPRFIVLLPITHSPPQEGDIGVEVPPRVRQALGLDDEPCWVLVSEYNVDELPSRGLRPLPKRARVFSYGFIPPMLFKQIRERFVDIAAVGRSSGVTR